MQFIDAATVAERLPYGGLVDALDRAFRAATCAPGRTHHRVAVEGGRDATLLLMPAWRAGGSLGVKIATVFPDNASRGIGSVHATYFLMDGRTGKPEAVIDGAELTLRRTACASALASRYLSRADASDLLMVGTGNLAPHLIAAHAAVRSLERVLIWGRREEAAHALARSIGSARLTIEVVTDLEAAVARADIISCATLATEPLIRGEWLEPGQHVDLVGAFTAAMREADGEALARARIFVDTRDGALAESGEIIQAMEEGLVSEADIIADLADLARGDNPGRQTDEEITLFKSVGTALEDLAAAELVAAAGRST
jgi:alanine dehydrogenase